MKKLDLISLIFLFVLLCSSLSSLGFAQPSWVEWSQIYGGIEDEGEFHLVYLVDASDGGYIIATNTRSFGAGSSDFWLIKVDSLGNIEWNQTYGGENEDRVYSLIQTTDGGYALAGRTYSFGAGATDCWFVKVDSLGSMEWNQTYGGANQDEALSVVQTSDGGYLIAGETWVNDGSDQDLWLIKIDAEGNMQWNRPYGGPSQETPFSLIETFDSGFVVAGRTRSFGAGSSDCWLVKVDSLGNMMWNQTYGGEEADHIESIVQTADGGFVLGATSESFTSGWTECWLIKTDNLGNMMWNKTYGGNETDWIHSLIITSDGGFAFVGETDSFGAGSRDFYLVKTDSDGNVEWSRTYGGEDLDFGQSLVETLDGGFVLAGNTKSFGAGGYDVWLIKTSSLGIPEFSSWMILLLFLVLTFVGILFIKKSFPVKS
jgi:predicted secreted protein